MEIIPINRDQVYEERQTNSINFARNVVINKKYNSICPEPGITLDTQVPGKVIVGTIGTDKEIIIFSTDNITGEIGRSINGVYTPIVRSSRLIFRYDLPIEGLYTYNYKRELIIIWWDGIKSNSNPLKILNVDCLPFALNIDYTLVNVAEIRLIDFSLQLLNSISISVDKVFDTGGLLEAGVYCPFIAYKFPDGSYSNFHTIGNWTTIYEDVSTNPFPNIKGNAGGVICNKAIKYKFENLDTIFEYIAIGFLAKVNGIISAFVFYDLKITSSTYYFTLISRENAVEVAIEELLIPGISFNKVQTGAILNNRLYFANSETIPDFDYQPYANNIKAHWDRTKVTKLAEFKDSYKDVIFIDEHKGFAANEVYAFYIGFKLKDGTYSKFFHIPGRAVGLLPAYGNMPENSKISDMVTAGFGPLDAAEYVAIASDARFHEVLSTALSTGEMGFFENNDEVYEDAPCWDIKDSTGTVIDSIRNEKVRHHRFPSFQQLNAWGNTLYDAATGVPYINEVDITMSLNNPVGNAFKADYTVNVISANFSSITTTDLLRIDTVNASSVEINFDFTVYTLPGDPIYINARIERASGVIEPFLLNTGSIPPLFNVIGYRYTGTYNRNMGVGDKLIVEVEVFVSSGANPIAGGGNINVKVNDYANTTGSTKVMGVRFTDIYIPNEIKEYISDVYFAYAQRTVNNSLKLGIGRTTNWFDIPNYRQVSLEDYSLLIKKPSIAPSYIRGLYDYTAPPAPPGGHTIGVTYNPVYLTPNVIDITRQSNLFQYIPKDVSVPVNNTGQEETLRIDLINSFPVFVGTMAEIYNYMKTVYTDFTSQNLVLIPKKHSKNVNDSGVIYGGDVFITAANDLYVTESKDNLALVYKPEPLGENEYPLNYNSDYTSILNFLKLLVNKCENICIPGTNKFPFRINRSIVSTSENTEFKWRKFLADAYFEMPDRHKGEVWKISAFNNTLIIHQKYSLYMAMDKDKLESTLTEVYLGVGDIFDRKPEEVYPTKEGFAGCQSRWGAIVCKLGYCFVDRLAGKVFIFDGKLREISKKGLNNFFLANLNYPKGSMVLLDEDNPITGNGISLGFDAYNNRLMLTKVQRSEVLGPISSDSFTMSYTEDVKGGGWIAEHDYIACSYVNTLNQFYSLNNASNLLSRLYNHTKESGIGIFYGGNINRSYIDILVKTENLATARWEAVMWLSDVEKLTNDEIFYDETITHIQLYNQYQATPEIPITPLSKIGFTANNSRHVQHNWFFNKIRDAIVNKQINFINDRGVINSSLVNTNKAWFNKSNFFSKFIVIRMIIDNDKQRRVYIKNVFADSQSNIR